jgi:trehalose 6-phosphate phosphatase
VNVPALDGELAWFLDIDGSLIEIAESPDKVVVPARLSELLHALSERAGGALALVSGRSIANIDRMFAPTRFPAAGQHGLERRTAHGEFLQADIDPRGLAAARPKLEEFARSHAGVVFEDKGLSLALHFRRAPQFADAARELLASLAQALGWQYHLQAGKCVVELKPAGYSKGTAIEAFTREEPFRSRRPAVIGDDVTDEDGFRYANAAQGVSIRVGEEGESVAMYRLPTVRAVHEFLLQQMQ